MCGTAGLRIPLDVGMASEPAREGAGREPGAAVATAWRVLAGTSPPQEETPHTMLCRVVTGTTAAARHSACWYARCETGDGLHARPWS